MIPEYEAELLKEIWRELMTGMPEKERRLARPGSPNVYQDED